MLKEKELSIPLAILEREIQEKDFVLVRLFVEFFGKKNARVIFDLLSQGDETNFTEANKRIFKSLRKRFPLFENLPSDEIEEILIRFYKDANRIVEGLINTSFTGMDDQLELLNTTSVPNLNLARRILLIASDRKSTGRYKYELLRQDLITLMLLELAKHNDIVENSKRLNALQDIMEEELFLGTIGEVQPQLMFSVHDNQTNSCLGTFVSLEEAQFFIKDIVKQNPEEGDPHIKRNKWSVRDIAGVGPSLVKMRIKSNFSIIRKILSKAVTNKENNSNIELSRKSDLLDTSGFMFIVPNGQMEAMREVILSKIQERYPNVKFVSKDKVANDRGQADNIDWLRFLVYLDNDSSPIEIVIMDQVRYLNYQLAIPEAHDLYELRKSIDSANLLFPQLIYKYDLEEVETKRQLQIKKIKDNLKNSDRI